MKNFIYSWFSPDSCFPVNSLQSRINCGVKGFQESIPVFLSGEPGMAPGGPRRAIRFISDVPYEEYSKIPVFSRDRGNPEY